MNDIEQDLRTALRHHTARGDVPIAAALRTGRRTRLARRLPTAVAGLAVVALGFAVTTSPTDQFELTRDGLTLTRGPGVTQVDGSRVDLGDGIQVWREDTTLYTATPRVHTPSWTPAT